uniref:SAM domain-containing protein n=1 Tax=Daphnia galeata TaxID=27404 RepID=A0A8J2WC55_9CRUS|nr:unnamed protein product [Daphnia galeata]
MATTVRRIKHEMKIRRSLSMTPKADSQSGPYKAVPAPKPLANPPPYRQPPPPANSSSPVLAAARPHLHHNDPSVVASAAVSAAASTAATSESNPESAGHGLLAHSSKFPIERQLVVTTGDKIAEVGRIERIATESKGSTENRIPATETDSSAMQTVVTQSAWNEERRTVTQGRHGEVIAGAPHHAAHHYPDGFDHVSGSEELHRPASYMPMHIHYTGWRQENNYVPMNFDGRVQQQQHQHQQQQQLHQHQSQQPFGVTGNSSTATSLGDHSLSFDSQHTGPTSMRDPFAQTIHPNSNHMTQYEIQVDSERADRPISNVTVAPWNNQASDTSTFDRLRDTCNKMFLRDGHLRGSSQFALSPTLPRAMERLTIDQRNGVEPCTNANPNNDPSVVLTSIQSEKAQREDGDTTNINNKNGSMRKKLSGKTYHHIKDMFTTKFNKSSKSKLNGTENNAGTGPANSSAANTAAAVAAAAAAAESIITEHGVQQNGAASQLGRQPDPVHSINQRIKSQLTGQNNSNQHTTNNNNPQQVWGSYGRQSARMEASINDSDASALAKLTLSPTSNGPDSLAPAQSPYSLRHKPSVTFRMDLNNECQYSGGDNSSSSVAASAVTSTVELTSRYGSRTTQGQVVLYDDTMHFPQHQQPAKEGPTKNSYGEHDSSLSSIASASQQGMKNRSVFSYSDYDVPPKSVSLNSPMMNEGGSSSGHQSAGSSSDLDKRSGQSVSTNDSGLGVLADPSGQRGRVNGQQNYHLDTSTETEMFVGRAGAGQLNQSSSDWAEAADREVNNVMEMRNYQSKQSQQGLQSTTPPLPPLSPDVSPKPTPKMQQKFSNSKPDLLEPANGPSPMVQRVKPTTPAKPMTNSHRILDSQTKLGHHAKRRGEDNKGSSVSKSLSSAKLRTSKSAGSLHPLTALQEALDLGDITSTTTGLDLDADSDSSSSHSDDDLSTTMDMNDSRTIRRQLEGLESMYSEVLKALHKKSTRSGPSDYKLSKRRMYGSVSSLPSSVCSRPVYRDRRRNEERRRPKESKSSNKRFQRLESHVVTLARSVAHLSSEMRTQHIMIQEMETIRSEIAQLRTVPLRMGSGNPYNTGASVKLPRGYRVDRDTCWQGAVPALTDPSRVKKLTSFFGDEPPLLRIFLKKLGYEKYAPLFDQEKIGMIELPYLTEERLHKMGIPMGPRIRILQEAQLSIRSDSMNDYGMV